MYDFPRYYISTGSQQDPLVNYRKFMGPNRNRGFWDVWFRRYVIDPQIAYQNELFCHILLFLKSIGRYIHLWSHWAHLLLKNLAYFTVAPLQEPAITSNMTQSGRI